MVEIKDRIKKIMEQSDLTSSAFAESIGIQQSTLSHILSGRNNPSLEVIMKIHQAYNSISLHWLLYGEGNMMEKTTSTISSAGPLFDFEQEKPIEGTGSSEFRKEMPLEYTQKDSNPVVSQRVKYIEKPARKIIEVRIFFDDNTFEVYKGDK